MRRLRLLTINDGMISSVGTVTSPSTQLLPTEPNTFNLYSPSSPPPSPVAAGGRDVTLEGVWSPTVLTVGGARDPDVLVPAGGAGRPRGGVHAAPPGGGGDGRPGYRESVLVI